jgi:hypothetical protein
MLDVDPLPRLHGWSLGVYDDAIEIEDQRFDHEPATVSGYETSIGTEQSHEYIQAATLSPLWK